MKYPIGVQSFEKLREDGFVYIDKTDLVYKLANNFQYVFLGRPRRFGKSLLMSTIQAYFEGKKDLFQGLAIEKLETDWTAHPVLHFDLNTGDYHRNKEKEIESVLGYQLSQYEKIYGGIEDTISNRFLNLIKSAYEQTGKSVVVLIDEYDKPILANMNDEDAQDAVRDYLKSFYGCLKTYDQYLRFAMFTGVSKFGHLSVFSDLNNIKDISLLPAFATICGLTKEEILDTFAEPIREFADELGITEAEMIEKLRVKYDGYRFSPSKVKVFNPFSLLNAMIDKRLNDYWFFTGTPSFLVKLLKKNDYDLSHIEGNSIRESQLYMVDNISAIPMLYQTGYLTIKDYNERRNQCILGYPNEEVESAFLNFLLPYYSNVRYESSQNELFDLVDEIEAGDVEAFMTRLQSLFSGIPYSHDNSAKMQEDQVRNLLYLIFKLMSLQIQVECPMSKGRSDAIVWTADHIYVFEFKVDHSAEEAIAQIRKNGYADPFRADPRQVTLIGVNYSTKERCIDAYLTVNDE